MKISKINNPLSYESFLFSTIHSDVYDKDASFVEENGMVFIVCDTLKIPFPAHNEYANNLVKHFNLKNIFSPDKFNLYQIAAKQLLEAELMFLN